MKRKCKSTPKKMSRVDIFLTLNTLCLILDNVKIASVSSSFLLLFFCIRHLTSSAKLPVGNQLHTVGYRLKGREEECKADSFSLKVTAGFKFALVTLKKVHNALFFGTCNIPSVS